MKSLNSFLRKLFVNPWIKVLINSWIFSIVWRTIYNIILGLRLENILLNLIDLKYLLGLLIWEAIKLLIKNIKWVKRLIEKSSQIYRNLIQQFKKIIKGYL